jgi:hypothetical protein
MSTCLGRRSTALTYMLKDGTDAVLTVDVPMCTFVRSGARPCKFNDLLAMVFELANSGNAFPRGELVEEPKGFDVGLG